MGYLTLAVSGPLNWVEWRHTPCLLGIPKKGTKSEMATEPLQSPGLTCRRNGDITLPSQGSPTKWFPNAHSPNTMGCPSRYCGCLVGLDRLISVPR